MKLTTHHWQTFEDIARRFQHKARYQDREDLSQDIILRLAEIASPKTDQLGIPAMLRVASYVVMEYWHKLKRSETQVCVVNGAQVPVKPDYGKCSLHHKPDSCSRCAYLALRPLLSLNYELEDEDGETVELWQTLADDKAIDVEAWLDARTWLLGCPKRLVQIGYKRYAGKPLDHKDRLYLSRHRQKEVKKYQQALLW